jgi:hypothetical protein
MASAVLFTLPLNADTLSLSIYIHSLTYALYTSLLKFGIKIDLVQQMCVPMERGRPYCVLALLALQACNFTEI